MVDCRVLFKARLFWLVAVVAADQCHHSHVSKWWLHRNCFLRIAVSSRSPLANRGLNAITLGVSQYQCDRCLRIAVSSRSLSANRGFHRDRSLRIAVFIAIALCESRFSSRSLSANRGIVAIALAIRGIRAIALANRRVFIAIALSESRYHRDRSRQIAASARSLSRIAGYSSRSLSANRGIIAIALGKSRHPRDRSRESPGLEGKRRRCLRRQRGVTVVTDYYNSDLTV